MPTVADALDPTFRRSWHEAVAIVQEAASQMSSGLNVPDAEHLYIDESGALSFGFANEGVQNPLLSLAVLLKGLLEGTGAPSGLQQLADENSTASPSHPTVESFSNALAFYERPARGNDLRAVAGRLQTHQSVANPEKIVENLREKIANQQTESKGVHKSSKRRRVVIAATALTIVVLASAGAMSLVGRNVAGGKRVPGIVDGIEQRIADVVSAGLDRLGGVKGATTGAQVQPAAPLGGTPAKVAAGKEPGRVVQRSSRTVPASTPVVAANPGAQRLAPMAPVPYAIDSAPLPVDLPTSTVRTEGADGVVYSAADLNVHPPVFVRPQLANQPAPDAQTGYFDILVSETGDVRMVKLFSPADKFRDLMLVAAAKAWRFRPAMLEGRPVSYRMRVSIILPGNP